MSTPAVSADDPSRSSVPSVEVDATSPTTPTDKKRKFWPFGKKKDDSAKAKENKSAGLTSDYSAQPARSPSPSRTAGMAAAGSPSRGANASPRVASPASSQIFERTVQEESLAPAAVPSAIPNHITTENHIPPALDASTMAITDAKLNPDNVEIFTHVAHTPAAVTVAQGTTNAGSASGITPSGVLSEASVSPTLPATSEEAAATTRGTLPPTSHPQSIAGVANEDGAASYGALDATDVRRLSFISFADVVHGEQVHSIGSDTPGHGASVSNLQPSPGLPSVPMQPLSPALSSTSPIISSPLRAASPARGVSPSRAVSPGAGVRASSPSLSASNLATSPKIIGASPSPPTDVQGELAVETMSQALRKTGSGDVGVERDTVSSVGSADGLGLTSR